MQKIPAKNFFPAIAWFFLVLVLTTLPGSDIPQANWLDAVYFDKWVHIGMFGGLTFLFCRPLNSSGFTSRQRLHYFIKITLAASIWGLTIEFIQKFYIPGRSFDLLDWAADSLGALLAFWICVRYFIKKPLK